MNYLAHPRTLEKFVNDNVFGWISPSGMLFEVRQYQHLEFFRHYKENDFPVGVKEYFEFATEHKEAAKAAWEADAGDEHPEWHKFDLFYEFKPEAELIMRCTEAAYDSGWGRIGTFGGNKLELECSQQYVRVLAKHVRELSKLLNRELIVSSCSLVDTTTLGVLGHSNLASKFS
jgi:hypothetical protein